MNFGVWALVAQQLINTTIDMVILWITVKWRPIRAFSLQRLKGLFSYGWKLLFSALIDTTYNNLRQLIIGKMYSSSDLAYFNRGKAMPNMIVGNINSSIDSVLLPALSKEQDKTEHVKAMTRRAIKTSSYIMWPFMIGLSVVAEPLTRLLLTEKWLPSVPYLRIFCIVFAFQPIQTANLNAIKAMGKSDIFLKLEIVKKSLGLLLLLLVMKHGVFVIAASDLLYSFIAQVLNSSPNSKLLNYSYFEQLYDILPSVGLACLMAAIIYPIKLLGTVDVVTIMMQVIAGGIIYIVGSIIFKLDSFNYVLNIMKKVVSKK
jgi:O-antigen/teichoic acid export membrane protein